MHTLERSVTIPQLALIAGTRAALGAGMGLLMGPRPGRDARKGAGWALLALGALTTIPLAAGLFGKSR
jgi:hypothetical protein